MFEQFDKQKYLNLETFRANGQGKKTPVWFAEEQSSFYIWTEASSYKVKRILNNENVKIVPSSYDGDPKGKWIDMIASISNDPEEIQKVVQLMKKKYGLSFIFFQIMGKIRRADYTTIQINSK